MCLMPKPQVIAPAEPPPPPPPTPPAPEATATGLTVGDQRREAPIKNFLKKSLGAQKNSLVVPVGGTSQAGAGLNIPR